MAYIKKLFNDNFLYYASYVIQDRAIPDIEDGLKPVQRRILHSLFEMDDGKYHKVANVVGHTMKYHPHGDASIYSALVVLANKGLFVDRQGNFGNIFTGDEASAARYIECKASSLAKDVFLNPKTTDFTDSYDGRNREPLHFPAKLPIAIMIGAEGIAVGMSTKILPHNPAEVIKAEISFLQGKSFSLAPDFPTGGLADFSDYRDGNGKVLVRAKLDTGDPKRIVITEIPFGLTTESLIESVEGAARSGQLKIASISDFTTERVEIEIKLARGVYTQEVVDALYAFTDCELSISCNCLVIKDGKPVVTNVSEIVRHHAGRLLYLLRRELEIKEKELLDEIHARTLERIFIEERVYKKIESMRTHEAVFQAVRDGLKPFAAEIAAATGRVDSQEKPREITKEDIEGLLKIQIRRISLYDIEKAKEELRLVEASLAEVRRNLAALVEYAIGVLRGFLKRLEKEWPRKTEVRNFSKVDAKEAARRDLALRYDGQTGYIGTSVSSGERVLEVSTFDRILVLRRNGIYSVVGVPEKLFVDKGLLWVALAEKESVASTALTVVYKSEDTGYPYIKRTKIEAWIIGKDYSLVPEGAQIVLFSTEEDFEFELKYAPKPRCRKAAELFRTKNYPVKGSKASGVRLATREVLEALSPAARSKPSGTIEPEFDQAIEEGISRAQPPSPTQAASAVEKRGRVQNKPKARSAAGAKRGPASKIGKEEKKEARRRGVAVHPVAPKPPKRAETNETTEIPGGADEPRYSANISGELFDAEEVGQGGAKQGSEEKRPGAETDSASAHGLMARLKKKAEDA